LKNNYYRNFDFKLADKLIGYALKEDIGKGDITSELLIPGESKSKAEILIKENGVIAGLGIFKRVLKLIDKDIKIKLKLDDGTLVKKGDIAGYVTGRTVSILKGERVALNLLQHMSGIASKTRKFIDLLNNKEIKIIDTRKTTPNLRMFEKLAVLTGGGENHRFGLYDMVLIKDNHIYANGGIRNTIGVLKRNKKRTRRAGIKIEIEVQNLDELRVILMEGKGVCDIIMLDNFSITNVKKAVKLIDNNFKIEISGGVNERNISSYRKIKGVDYISVGALTHSVKSLDISLDFIS
jgi:nicotinate-nucleotide pyrophosphorylase (carboxylating)